MDALPLPRRPHLEGYRKRAEGLVSAATSDDESAVRAWAVEWLDAMDDLMPTPPTALVQESLDRAVEAIERHVRGISARGRTTFALADAELLVARAHGFASWAEFARQVERLSGDGSDPFELAADAVVGGGLAALEALLRADPGLAHARSARVHGATLLHYVAANGVEDFRQKTPQNAVAIARALLEAGAAVDAVAETYGGAEAQTTLNLLVSSAHPAEAGNQPALVETLLDFGAAVDGLQDDGSPLMTALAFGYPDAAETLARRGARIDNVMAAAGLGRVDLVARILDEGAAVNPSLVNLYWLELTGEPASHVERAFVWACAFGRVAVVELLLARGVDPAVADMNRMTGLHWAAANRHLDVAELLIDRGAPLEVRNRWGGTVLDSTVYFALGRASEAAGYVPVLELLIRAGADVSAVTYPTGNETLDELLERHASSQSRVRDDG
jgi:ankyrin repeat protein